MAINFPNNPNPNDTWTSGGKTWLWDGTSWKLNSTPATGISLTDLSVTKPNPTASGGGDVTYNSTTGAFTYTPPVVGSTSFIGLSDTPGSLTAGKWLKVNAGGNALEMTNAPSDTNDYLNTASLSGNTLTLTRTGSQSLANVTVDLSALNSVPTTITVADESTDTTCYPLFTTEATGDLEPKTGSNIKFNSASGQLEAGSFKKTGGTAVEFLKADGSIDSTTYLSSVALNDLSNVDATTNLANGKILKYDSGSSEWVVADDNSSGGGSGTFVGLSDTPSSLTANKWIKVNSGGTALEWTDAPSDNNTTYDLTATSSSGNAVVRLAGSDSTNDDVTFSAGGGISYNITGNTIQVSSVNTLGGLSDTTISGSPTDNYVLTYDSATSKWEPQPVPSGSTPTLNAVLGAGNTSSLAATVGDFTCSNLTVNGTQTIVNSNTVNIGDNIIVLNSDEAGTPSQNGGIEIERGTSSNVSLRWNETSDKWQYTNDGSTYSDIGSGDTYTIEALASPGIQLLDNGNAGASNRVFFDAGSGMSLTRTSTSPHTIEFSVNMIDEDDMTSNSNTRPPTQQSVKAYVDNNVTTNTNTTYDLSAVAVNTTSAKIRLAAGGSGSGNDDVTLSASGGIQYTTSGNNIQISSLNNLGTLTDVNFGGGTPSNDQILQYDSSGGTGGSGAWVLVDGSSIGGTDTNNYASSFSWNTGNGVLTLNRSGLSSITVDLDGRYATGTIPTNNNQLTNGAGYITSSGTITNSEKVRIRTDTGNLRHNLVFVDSYSDNQFQVLKVDNADWSCCYNPNSNCLSAAALQSYHMRDWSNSSTGSSGQFLMSKGSAGWEWSSHVYQTSSGELRLKATGGLEGGHLQLEDMLGSTSYAIDVYRNSSSGSTANTNKVLRFIDQSKSLERFSVGPEGQWGIGHVGARNFGSTGQVMISGGPNAAPYWGNHSQISGSSFASTEQGEKADAADTDIDNIYTQLVAIGNDDTITTVAQLKTALLSLVRKSL